MTAADALNQRGSWMESAHRGSCTMCGGVWEPGSQVRYDPQAGDLVCSVCGQEEPDEVSGILGQAPAAT